MSGVGGSFSAAPASRTGTSGTAARAASALPNSRRVVSAPASIRGVFTVSVSGEWFGRPDTKPTRSRRLYSARPAVPGRQSAASQRGQSAGARSVGADGGQPGQSHKRRSDRQHAIAGHDVPLAGDAAVLDDVGKT